MGRLDLKRRPSRSLVVLLMLGLCATGQVAPRVVHRPPLRSGPPILNTTLPVPETAVSENGRRAVAGIHVLAHVPVEDGIAPERATRDHATGDHATGDRPTGAFPIRWRESREIAAPEIISLIRNYKRDGLPVVPLWQSEQSRVAIGLNPHGLPGIYFTHHVGG